jgi:histidine-containing phosphotransfer protein
MDAAAVQQMIQQLLAHSVQEGLLDDQFLQLIQLQDESNPDFVAEVVELYFEDSASKLDTLQARLAEPAPSYSQIDALVHQFKGSSASFGAHTMAALCVQLRDACHAHNQPACQQLVAQLRDSFGVLKARLEQFMQLERQRKQLGGS